MTTRIRATATTQIDNEHTVVTEWSFAPGSETGHHKHRYNYVVVPMTDGVLTLETAAGQKQSTLVAGRSYPGVAGNEHNVVNATSREIVFVEV